ncbi:MULTISPECIES: hypothetical protein [Bacillales]|uniref:hypothetical protein n=1 Tax=Bacillales TaxID=1385 RepID=UPI000DE2B38E|nr:MULTISPECIES: hypothetical protein [Bacillales]MBX0351800.1 hypothetical protein [Bacillus toyonensis]MDA1786679.1 hypothetical protein [Bacillus cereus]MDA1909653.1 hypothetical protein [Bacillus cereus]MDA2191584.1 hypothetical protein [Bacillus cereus]MDA2208549.1 hypothetical protein [Bacillus cereus]
MESKIPSVSLTYNLGDVSTAVSNWFGAYWLIIAFAVAIPLAFLIAHRVKNLFVA